VISDCRFEIISNQKTSFQKRKSKIGNRQLEMLWMAGQPRLLPFQEATPTRFKAKGRGTTANDESRVLLATFSIRFVIPRRLLPRFVTSTHLAPSSCEPGRVSHPPISNCGLRIADFVH